MEEKQNNNLHFTIAIIFSFVLLIVFIFAAIIFISGKNHYQIDDLVKNNYNPGKGYYCLKKNRYHVIEESGKNISTNTIYRTPVVYYYFTVSVDNPSGTDFIMTVRTLSKASSLRKGNTADLCGRISKPNDIILQKKMILSGHENIVVLCLYDNDMTKESDMFLSVIFMIFGIADILLIKRIILRRKSRIEYPDKK